MSEHGMTRCQKYSEPMKSNPSPYRLPKETGLTMMRPIGRTSISISTVLSVSFAVILHLQVGSLIWHLVGLTEHFRITGVCDACRDRPQMTITGLLHLIQKGENRLLDVQRICSSCTGSAQGEPVQCVSIDCPWFFERKKAKRKVEFLTVLEEIIDGIEHDL